MNEEAAPGGFRLRRYGRVGSTSDLCIRLAAEGEPEGAAVLAVEQSAGRGTNGREWESGAGNLFLSVLLRPPGTVTAAKHYSLLAGLALLEALREFIPVPEALSLKWPNDVLLDGAKVAGILIETATNAADRLAWLVAGFGANLQVAPRVPEQTTACLADTGVASPRPRDAANAILTHLAHWRGVEAVQGFAPVRAAWLRHAHPHGTSLIVADANGEHHGRFAGLDADGALLLTTESGTMRCVAGRVREATGALQCSS